MIGPPPLVPIQICAWIEPPPALIVTVAPFEYVGQLPFTFGRFGGIVPLTGGPLDCVDPPSSPVVPPVLASSPAGSVGPRPLDDPDVDLEPLLELEFSPDPDEDLPLEEPELPPELDDSEAPLLEPLPAFSALESGGSVPFAQAAATTTRPSIPALSMARPPFTRTKLGTRGYARA
jgi:hypothetical protein